MKIALLTNRHRSCTGEAVGYLISRGHKVDYWFDKHPIQIPFWDYDLVISYFYPHILKPEHFNAPTYGTINIHTSYLPYGRGAHPNVWAMVNDEPAGVTIHWIDEGVDTGNILSRTRVEKFPEDTGEELYRRLENASIDLFSHFWPSFEQELSNGNIPLGEPQESRFLARRVKELDGLRDLESVFYHNADLIKDAINIIRACTFTGHKGAYIRDENGEKVYMELKLYRD